MNLEEKFEALGGVFLTSIEDLSNRAKTIDCFVFDWDGVFNNGVKTEGQGSPFSEADSMGVNMLRFAYFLKHGKLPLTAIITGENNQTALHLANREHFDAVLLKAKNKGEALEKLCEKTNNTTTSCAFIFDDILDISASQKCGLSFCIQRSASPLFQNFVLNNKLANYISANTGGQHAVREISELLIGLMGNYEETIQKRIAFDNDYQNYLNLRAAIRPLQLT